ncbi:MAG: hypothetical protein V1905_01590 [bacterium]
MGKDKLAKKQPQKIQNEIFRKMSAEKKIKMVSHFFEFGKKLNKLNGNRKPSYKNS